MTHEEIDSLVTYATRLNKERQDAAKQAKGKKGRRGRRGKSRGRRR